MNTRAPTLRGIWEIFFFQAEDGIRDVAVTGVQTCALPISALAACTRPSASDLLARATWVDLTYDFDSTTIYWPTAKPFRLEVVSAQRTAAGYYYAANNIAAAEHGGTHLDAPVHFAEGKHTTDQIPITQLAGVADVIDVTRQAEADRDYRITPADLEAWEHVHGPIAAGAIVLSAPAGACAGRTARATSGPPRRARRPWRSCTFPGSARAPRAGSSRAGCARWGSTRRASITGSRRRSRRTRRSSPPTSRPSRTWRTSRRCRRPAPS